MNPISLTDKTFDCLNNDLEEILVLDHPAGSFSVFSHRSPDKETLNEDSLAIIPVSDEHLVCIVADGLGGQPKGDQASSLTVKMLSKKLLKSRMSADEVMQTILNCLEQANQKLVDMSSASATTVAIAEIYNQSVRSYHIGDSAVLITGQRGRIKMETISHSPVGYAVESGLIDESESLHHDERHYVSNVIGTKDMHISISSPVNLQKYDTLLLASDGLFDNLHKSEITEVIRKGPLDKCGKILKDKVYERMTDPVNTWKPDDLSFILFRPVKQGSNRVEQGK